MSTGTHNQRTCCCAVRKGASRMALPFSSGKDGPKRTRKRPFSGLTCTSSTTAIAMLPRDSALS